MLTSFNLKLWLHLFESLKQAATIEGRLTPWTTCEYLARMMAVLMRNLLVSVYACLGELETAVNGNVSDGSRWMLWYLVE